MDKKELHHLIYRDVSAQETTLKNNDRLLRLVLFLSVTVLLFSLGHRALWDPDEGRYAEMAREILVLNDWVTPHLNYLLYFEKPMLFMWLEALSFKLFGVSEWAARLVSLLAALGGTASVGFLAWKLWGRRAGLIASLILITSLEYFFLACAVDINMTLTLFITAAMVFFWLGHRENKTGWFYLSWISMALAVLTKGPIGIILPGGAIGLYVLISKQFSLIRKSKPVQGIFLFLLIALPWYLLVSIRNPDFFSFFFINQNIQRYTASNEHNRPFFYLFLVILAGALPWTLLLPSAIRKIRNKPFPDEILFILIWFSLIFLFFLPSHSKLATYVLPCFPPLALLVAYSLKDSPLKGGISLYLAGAVWTCIGTASLVFPALAGLGFIHASLPGIAPLVRIGLPAGLIIFTGAAIGIWLGKNHDAAMGLAVMSIALMISAVIFAPQWDTQRSTKALVQDLPQSAKLFAYKEYDQSSSFYANRRVGLVMCRGELDFGIRQNKNTDAVLTLKELAEFMNKDKNTYCLIRAPDFSDLQKLIPELAMVRQTSKHCLVSAQGRLLSLLPDMQAGYAIDK